MKKRLTKKSSIEPVINTKFSPVPDAVSRLAKDIGQRDYPETYKKQIMYEWIDYSQTAQRRLSLEGFSSFKGLCRDTIKNWGIKDPWVLRMINEGNSIIAERRYDMALFREIDKDMFKWNQHKFDPEVMEIHQMWAALNKKDEQAMGDIHVHIDEAPSSDKVPHKKGKQ